MHIHEIINMTDLDIAKLSATEFNSKHRVGTLCSFVDPQTNRQVRRMTRSPARVHSTKKQAVVWFEKMIGPMDIAYVVALKDEDL